MSLRMLLAVVALVSSINITAPIGAGPLALRGMLVAAVVLILPGLFTLRAAAPRLPLSRWEWFFFGLLLSVLGLMAGGLALSFIGPLVGLNRPLEGRVALAALDLALLAPATALWLRSLNHAPRIQLPRPGGLDLAIGTGLVGVVALSVLGAIRLNNGTEGGLTLVMLGAVAVLATAIMVLRERLSRAILPLSLYAFGLVLLLMNSLRGWAISGHDVLLEYYVFELTRTAGIWNIEAFRDPYNACLSITILPTLLANLTGISDPYIYKALFQVLAALAGVATYKLARGFAPRWVAYLAGLAFITFPTYMTDLPMLGRQEIALLFFSAMLLVMFNERLGLPSRRILFVVFGLGVILSHYSTAYVTVGLFGLGWLLYRFFGLARRLAAGRKARLLVPVPFREPAPRPLVTLSMVLLLAGGILLWNGAITGTSQGIASTLARVARSADNAAATLAQGAFTPAVLKEESLTKEEAFADYRHHRIAGSARGEYPEAFYAQQTLDRFPARADSEPMLAATPLGIRTASFFGTSPEALTDKVKGAYGTSLQVLIVVGSLLLLYVPARKLRYLRELPPAYPALAAAGVGLIGAQVVLPQSVIDYGLLRLIQQNLTVLALPAVVALLNLGSLLRLPSRAVPVAATATLMFFFLTLSGFFPQLFGASRPQMNLNNAGFYYDAYYTRPGEIHAFGWLSFYARPDDAIQSDRYFASTKMLAYGGIYPDASILPETLRRSAYIYVDNAERVYGRTYVGGDIVYYSYPIGLLDENKNLVYSNADARIYK